MNIYKVIYLFVLFVCPVSVFPQNKQAMEVSDSLFAKGVELYNQGVYWAAIPIFEKSDSIDKVTLDSASVRRDYSVMWLAACYKKTGLTDLSDSIYKPFYYEPVDRRLTLVSDSLADLAIKTDSIQEKILYLTESAKIEAQILGEAHQFRANSLSNIILYQTLIMNLDGVKKTFNEIYRISLLNKELRLYNGLDIPFMYLLNKSETQEEYLTYLDKMIYLTSLSKEDEDNKLWRYFIKDKTEKLFFLQKYDTALKNATEAYAEVTQTSVPNETLFEITSLLATSYLMVQKTLYVDDAPKRESIQKMRMRLYDKMLHMAKKVWGSKSLQYGITKYKIANLNLGMGETLNIEDGKNLLIDAFNTITLPENLTLTQCWDIIEVVEDAVRSFDVANANDEFIYYADRIINAYESKTFIDLSKIREAMARTLSYGYGDIKKEKKSLDIYTALIKNSKNIEDSLSYLKSRAAQYRSLKEYEQSLCDYLAVDSLYKLKGPKNFLEESILIDNYLDIATLYFNLSDTANCKKYSNLYCNASESLIERIINGDILTIEHPAIDDMKIEIIHSYAQNISFGTNIDIANYNKAIKYYNMLLEFLKIATPITQTVQGYKRGVYRDLSNIYIIQRDFPNASNIIKKLIDSSVKDNDFNKYIAGLENLSTLYERVSVEPELSLQYRLQVCELLSENLISNKSKMLKEEYVTNLDLISQSWDKCADNFEYLGDASSANRCHQRNLYYMERLEGKASNYYANALYSYLSNYKIPYYHYVVNNIEKARTCLDSLVTYFQNYRQHLNGPRLLLNYCNIGLDFFYLGDTLTAKKYYDIFECELKDKYPVSFQKMPEYLDLLECKADLQKGRNRINALKEIEVLYEDENVKFISEFIKKSKYHSVLFDIATEYAESADVKSEIEYRKKLYEEFPNDYNHILDLIKCYIKSTDYDKIVSIFNEASIKTREGLLTRFKTLPAEEREWIWQSLYEIPFTLGEALADRFPRQISPSLLFNNVLMRKNLLLNASISAENLIKSEGDSLLLAKYERMTELLRNLKSDNDSIENMGRVISREQANNLVKRFNKEIMERAAMLGDFTSSLFVEWQSVQKALPENSIAIEFTSYSTFSGEKSYAALVLTNEEEPLFIPLFKENHLRKISFSDYYNTTKLYDLIWKPLETLIKNKDVIYFSPDGELFNIAVENIPYGENGLLACDKYNLYRLSSTREIVSRGKPSVIKNAAIYGGLKFDTGTDVLINDSKKYNHRDFSFESLFIADSLNLRSGVSDLPATKYEVLAINQKLKKIKIETLLFTDTLGTEASFKDLSGRQINLLHTATHGFYWTDSEAQKMGRFPFLSSLVQNRSQMEEDKALTRSGLLLSGVNNALTGKLIPPNIEDGILTAKEISELDLRGLDMVVLSACQTGLGDIKGDGVFGLQRGFKKAGAHTLLMSLWKVDDKATQMLMTHFYENLTSGKGKLESLREAQRYVREYVEMVKVKNERRRPITAQEKQQYQIERKKNIYKAIKIYENPIYWAAFILLDAIE